MMLDVVRQNVPNSYQVFLRRSGETAVEFVEKYHKVLAGVISDTDLELANTSVHQRDSEVLNGSDVQGMVNAYDPKNEIKFLILSGRKSENGEYKEGTPFIFKAEPTQFTDYLAKNFPELSKSDLMMNAKDNKVPVNQRAGGVDLSSADKALQTRGGEGSIQFHLDDAILARLQNAPGFVPNIINIEPLEDLKAFLGEPLITAK